jgi:hypothetical protein
MMAGNLAKPPITDPSVDMPRPNFPLPRELRDKIYEYLLDSKYARIKRKFDGRQCDTARDNNLTGPRAYQFHTNILAVNQEIHNESKELLYKRNIFVVISYQWPQLNHGRGGLYWIPIVSDKHIAKMTLHSVRIHVSQTKATKYNTATDTPRHSFLLLAKDLEAFCCAMHSPYACAPVPYIWVATLYSSEARFGTKNIDDHEKLKKPTQLLCEFKDTTYRTMDSPTQHDILRPISSIIGTNQRVVFNGNICDLEDVERSKRIMSPALLCIKAFRWAFLQNLTTWKTIANASIEHDDTGFVLQQYTIIERILALRLEAMEAPSSIHERAEEDVTRTFRLEVTLNIAIAKMKMGMLSGFIDDVEEIGWFVEETSDAFGESWKMPAKLEAYHVSADLWFDIYRLVNPYSLRTVRKVVSDLTQVESGPHQIHDLEILKRHTNQDDIITNQHLPFEQCSARQLPLPGTSFYETVDSMSWKSHYHGFHDLDLLRSLTGDQRKSINDLQKRYRLGVTDFDN